jgi:hypothetical protein
LLGVRRDKRERTAFAAAGHGEVGRYEQAEDSDDNYGEIYRVVNPDE